MKRHLWNDELSNPVLACDSIAFHPARHSCEFEWVVTTLKCLCRRNMWHCSGEYAKATAVQLRTGSDQGKEGAGRSRKHSLELVQALAVCPCVHVFVCLSTCVFRQEYCSFETLKFVNILIYFFGEMLQMKVSGLHHYLKIFISFIYQCTKKVSTQQNCQQQINLYAVCTFH